MAENWKKVARDAGFNSEKEMWDELYTRTCSSIKNLADRLGFGTYTVKRRLSIHGVVLRSRGGNNGATPPKRDVLFHLDQRVVFNSTIDFLTELTGCSPAVISNYRTRARGGVE